MTELNSENQLPYVLFKRKDSPNYWMRFSIKGHGQQRIGLLLGAVIHAADIQDRDGAPEVLKSIRHSYPWLAHIFADGGYARPKLRKAMAKIGDWKIEIVTLPYN